MHFIAWARILLTASHANVSLLFFYNPQLFQKFNLFVFTDGFQLLCYGLYMAKRTREQKWKEQKWEEKKRPNQRTKKTHFISNGKRENEIQDKIALPLVMWSMNICATVCFSLLSFRLCSCFHFAMISIRRNGDKERKSAKFTYTHTLYALKVRNRRNVAIDREEERHRRETDKKVAFDENVAVLVIIVVATAAAAAAAAATNGYELKCGSIKGTTMASTLIKASTC